MDTRRPPKEGQYVEFNATIGRSTALIVGIAVNVHPNIGFGVRFENLPEGSLLLIADALKRAQDSVE